MQCACTLPQFKLWQLSLNNAFMPALKIQLDAIKNCGWTGSMWLQCFDAFVDELCWEEQDLAKCDKIYELKLTSEEWEQVDTFLGLLSVCVQYFIHQHWLICCSMPTTHSKHFHLNSFISTLHLAIPVLEALYKAWSSQADHTKYQAFADTLYAACKKVDEYYEKTTKSPVYIMSMSMNSFHWGNNC